MEFLIFGTIWFWVLISVAVILSIYFLDEALHNSYDSGGGVKVTLVILGTIAAYYFFGSKEQVVSAFEYLRDNPFSLLGWFGAYLVLGLIWGFVKWYFFLHKKLEKEKDRTYYDGEKLRIPTAAENKYRIMSWMMYWPFSAIWTVIDQPIKHAFNYVFAKFEGWFDAVSKKMYADVEKKYLEQREQRKNERNGK